MTLFSSPIRTSLGFGTYRVTRRNPTHAAALREALESAHCGLIDTSSNYMNGEAEELVGQVVSELIKNNALRRESVQIVTKVGYIQGEELERCKSRARLDSDYMRRLEIVVVNDDCWHSMSPEFLEQQLTLSAQRLGPAIGAPDGVLLHNPEYFLHTQGNPIEYYARLERAFTFLEAAARAGRIQSFGVSSNTFGEPSDSPTFTSLAALLDIAQKIRAAHFKIIQGPFNLLEPGLAFEPNNGNRTTLELARESNLTVLINRPLNAITPVDSHGERLLRLVTWRHPLSETAIYEELKTALQQALQEESANADLGFQWAHRIQKNLEKLSDFQAWRNILAFQIEPDLAERSKELPEGESRDWFTHYGLIMKRLFKAMDAYADSQVRFETNHWSQLLDSLEPALRKEPLLQRKLLVLYSAVPGIGHILIGMRRAAYAQELCAPLQCKITAESALQIFREAQKALEPHTH